MQCPKCGAELHPDSQYCTKCFCVFAPDRRLYDDSEKGQAEYEAEIERRKFFAKRSRESHERIEELNRQTSTSKKALIIVISVFAALFIFGMAITMSSSRSSYSSPSSGGPYSSSSYMSEDVKAALWALAQEAVKNSLKAPSTAQFPASYDSSGVSFGREGDLYTVSAWVDAENGFGATLRTDFKVYAELDGVTLKLDHVEFEE